MVPLGWLAVRDPASILPYDQHEDIWAIQEKLDFPSFVFGLERQTEGKTIMKDMIERYLSMLQKRHAGDVEQLNQTASALALNQNMIGPRRRSAAHR